MRWSRTCPPGGVLGEPALEPRPLPQERLVGDLDVAVAAVSRRAAVRVARTSPRTGSLSASSSVERDAAADELGALAGSREAQEERPGDRLAVRVELGVGGLGQPRDGALEAAARRGTRRASGARRRAPPRARAGRSRAAAGPRARVPASATRAVGQLGLDPQPDPLRGMLDDRGELGARQRTDEDLVGAERAARAPGRPRSGRSGRPASRR